MIRYDIKLKRTLEYKNLYTNLTSFFYKLGDGYIFIKKITCNNFKNEEIITSNMCIALNKTEIKSLIKDTYSYFNKNNILLNKNDIISIYYFKTSKEEYNKYLKGLINKQDI